MRFFQSLYLSNKHGLLSLTTKGKPFLNSSPAPSYTGSKCLWTGGIRDGLQGFEKGGTVQKRSWSTNAGSSPKKITKRMVLISDEDYESFVAEFPQVVKDVITMRGMEEYVETNAWLKRVIEYNVPYGKLLRPKLLLGVAKELQKVTGKDLPNLNRIAWAYEFYQGFGSLHDDMMDASKTRRDQPCWYLVDNLGMYAINDGDLLYNAACLLLRKYCRGIYPLYSDILDMIHETYFRGLYGQSLDSHTSRAKDYNKFNMNTYRLMMTFKNGIYTFYAPTVVGLMLNGQNDPGMLLKVEEISKNLGMLYSIQDDFIDCFVEEKDSGKIGMDIQDGKMTWLIITAMELCKSGESGTKEYRQILVDNYGYHDLEKEAKVKAVYNDLGIEDRYYTYERETVKNILDQINNLPEIVPREPLKEMLAILEGRSR